MNEAIMFNSFMGLGFCNRESRIAVADPWGSPLHTVINPIPPEVLFLFFPEAKGFSNEMLYLDLQTEVSCE